MKEEIKFNIPKDKEDKRKLLIDLENNVGVILREENGFFIVTPYKVIQPKAKTGWEERLMVLWANGAGLDEVRAFIANELERQRAQIEEKVHDYFKKIVWSDKDIEYFDRAVFEEEPETK